jgi:hypothetical protein
MIRTLLTKLGLEREAFEAAITLRPPNARRMSDEIRDALRARTPMAAVSSTEQDTKVAGDVAARSIQAVNMALENKPEARPLAKARESTTGGAGNTDFYRRSPRSAA